jgi:hypothetical protein
MILSVSFYNVQTNKQESIEAQKQMEIDQENKKLEAEQEKLDTLKFEKENDEYLLDTCLSEADSIYMNYATLNGTENSDGTVWAKNSVWDKAQDLKDNAVNICFKKYK